ncbi:TonB-dependent receptor plug domain-containing protein [bacterium]|nr:TonB-dependent receptor plug domain-containing protein [bacterium]
MSSPFPLNRPFIVCFLFPVCLSFLFSNGFASIPEEMLDMSLEELMQVEVYAGTITGTERIDSPVAHTEITREMIETTPARDLLDLLEIYVPGATYVNHYQGPRIGIRGVLGDQNYSFLLLVNGRNMNLRMLQGPQYEIQNMELNDIKRIEVIRGPGSVTYGPGAIGGVINIITKSPSDTDPGLKVFAEGNLEYRYANASLQYARRFKDLSIIANAGISRSLGLDDTRFYYVCWADHCGYGFMGPDWGGQGYGSDAPHLFEDFNDRPEYKINLEAVYKEQLRFWMRYTSFQHTKLIQEQNAQEGPAFSGLEGASFVASTSYTLDLSPSIVSRSSVGFDSKRYRDHQLLFGSTLPFDDIRQRSASFSENIADARSVLEYTHSEDVKIAAGAEFEYQWYGPEWGLDRNTFLYRFQRPLQYVVLDESSEFHQYVIDSDVTTVLNETIDGNMVSLFAEGNWRLFKRATLLLSGRADKHVYADWAFSPRTALMYTLDSANHFRLVWQQSVRLPVFSDLFSEDRIAGSQAETERVSEVELAYTRMQSSNLRFRTVGFYNIVDQVAWLVDEGHAGRVGTFEAVGLELEGTYSSNHTRVGGSYSYVDQLSWDPAVPTDAYLSNMGPDSIDVPLEGYAMNRMNNIPKHALKLHLEQDIQRNLHLHVDGRVYWAFGQIDMLNQFLQAHEEHGTAQTLQTMRAIYDEMLDYGYSRPSFTTNLLLNWQFPFENVKVNASLYALNLISHNHIRYVIQYWAAGNQRQFPRQAGFVEEPRSYGLTLTFQL